MVIGMQSTTMAAESAADAAFHREFGDAFFDRFWQLNPDWAIAVGYYKYADRLIVPDEKARAAQLEQDERWLKSLHRIDPTKLSPNVRADWAILVNAFEADRWSLTELRSWQWNPSNYNVADPFALLATLEYAPLEQRLRDHPRAPRERARVLRGGEAQRREPDARAYCSSRSSRTAARSTCSATTSSARSRPRSSRARSASRSRAGSAPRARRSRTT